MTLQSRGGYTIDTDVPLRAALQGKDYSLFEASPDFPKNAYRLRNPYHNLDARFLCALPNRWSSSQARATFWTATPSLTRSARDSTTLVCARNTRKLKILRGSCRSLNRAGLWT